MKGSSPFSRLPQPNPPRGKRPDWPGDYELPTRLELETHGLWERGMACYGFAVWDVGQNRLAIQHGALVGRGDALDAIVATQHAILAGLRWLIRQEEHRRRVVVCIDNPLVYDQIDTDSAIQAARHGAVAVAVQRALEQLPQHTLQLVPDGRNHQAVLAADRAFVSAQEAERLERAAEVVPELQPVGDRIYLVRDRYRVDLKAGTCTCPDFRQVHTERHPIRCKHLLAALQVTGKSPQDFA